jgi:general secretion pathway protein D
MEKLRFLIKLLMLLFCISALFSPGQSSSAEEIKEVALDFDDVDIRLFIRVMSELTGRNFIIDNNVKGKITVLSPKKLNIQQAYEVFKSVLSVNGFALVEAGQVTKVVPAQQMSGHELPVMTDRITKGEDQYVTQIMPLKHLDGQALLPVIKPLLSKQGSVFAAPSGELLIVTDTKSNVKKTSQLLEEIDIGITDAVADKLDLKHASASDVATKVTEILELKYGKVRKGVRPTVFKVIPLDRINAVLAVAPSDIFEEIMSLVSKIDQPSPEGKSLLNVYYLEHAKAEDMVRILTETQKAMSSFTESRTTTTPATPTRGARETPAGIDRSQRTEAGGTVVGGKFKATGKEISIMADKSTNSLIIFAEPDDYNTIREMIKKLDIPRKQVYIQALLMEVSPTEDFNFGSEWSAFKQTGSFDGADVFAVGRQGSQTLIQSLLGSAIGLGSAAAAATAVPGLTLGVIGEPITIGNFTFPSLAVLTQAAESLRTINIISRPQLMTLNNEQAAINISTNRPFRTTETILEGGGTSQNIDYRDIGIKLKITPNINKVGKIKLEISLEVSRLQGTVAVDQPITLKRAIDTVVEVNNRNTIVIGGLIDEQQDFSKDAAPCLGSLPVAGWAFKSVGRSGTKTNLLVFLSPSVYETPEDASAETRDMKEFMEREGNRQQQDMDREMPFFKNFKSNTNETVKEEAKP